MIVKYFSDCNEYHIKAVSKKAMKRKMWIKKRGHIFAILLVGCMLTGCSSVGKKDENLILIEKEQESLVFEMEVASLSDVKKTEKASCTYQQVNDESLSFSVSGKRVAKVYVEEGDIVTKGQLLAELDIGNAKEQIRDLEYNIARNELQLKYIDINEQNDISSAWLRYGYQSGQSTAEYEATVKSVEGIQQRYRYSREDCQDALALDKAQLDILKKNVQQSSIYAGMDGSVSKIKKNLEGSTTVRDEEVIKIIDSSECLFAVKDVSLKDWFKEGEEVDLKLAYGTGAGDYKLVPYNMENWTDVLLFTLSGIHENVNIEVGVSGTMRYTTGFRAQVLSVPLRAVHQAEGKSFVYVLGENQMREVRWIETGLFGDERVEVLSGLTEGEKVIIK